MVVGGGGSVILLGLLVATGCWACNSEASDLFSITMTASPLVGRRSRSVTASDISSFVDAWNARTSDRGRSAGSFPTFSVFGDHANGTYVGNSAFRDGTTGFDIVTGILASHEEGDSAIVVSDSSTDTVYVSTQHDGYVQNGFIRNGAIVHVDVPYHLAVLPNEEEPYNVSDVHVEGQRRCAPEISPETGRTIIRVGVLHTPQAAELAQYRTSGGSRAVEMVVAAAVAEANSVIYPKSGINMELQLCTNGLLSDREMEQTTAGSTLVRFSNSQQVSAIRDAGNCDVMTLFATLDALGRRACGLGYLFPGVHSIVAARCFKDNYSFIHELHHNFGSCHGEPAVPCGSGANGYGDPSNGFRTIEAYPQACGTRAQTCARVPRVSNSLPGFKWNEWPIGDLDHNNAWLINMRSETMSARQCT